MRPIALHTLTWGTVVGSMACTLWLAVAAGDIPPGASAARSETVQRADQGGRAARIPRAETEAAAKR